MEDPMDIVIEATTAPGIKKRKEPVESFDEDNECFACMERYNRSRRSRVKCDFCHYESCRECHMRYLLDTISDPHCMNCKKPWLDTVLLAKFSKVMVRELWQRKVEFIYQHQRSFMNYAARFMENSQRSTSITHEMDQKFDRRRYLIGCAKTSSEYNRLERQLISARIAYTKLDNKDELTVKQTQELERLRVEKILLEEQIDDLIRVNTKEITQEIERLETERARLPLLLPTTISDREVARFRDKAFGYCFLSPEERAREPPLLPHETNTSGLFLLPASLLSSDNNKAPDLDQRWNCPASCRGVLNAEYKCCVCSKVFCDQCIEEKKPGHKCDSDQKANITNIRKTTKPCPKCLTRIFRSSGCDQMWCVNCHTAFDWKSGNEVHGSIHNPLYFEYLSRRQNQDNGIDYCNDISPHVIAKVQQLTTLPFRAIFLQYQEIRDEHVVLNEVRGRRDFYTKSVHAPIPACFRYLQGILTEDKWKADISFEMMHERSNREYYAIYQGFLITMEEALRQLEAAHKASIFQNNNSQFVPLPHPPRYRKNLEVVISDGKRTVETMYHYATDQEAEEYCKVMRGHFEGMVEILRSANYALHEVSKAYKIPVPRFLMFNRGNNREYAENPFTNIRYRESLLSRVDPVQHMSRSKDLGRKYTAKQLLRKPRPRSQILQLYNATVASSDFKHSRIDKYGSQSIQWLHKTSEAELDLLPPIACRQMRSIMFDYGIVPYSVIHFEE